MNEFIVWDNNSKVFIDFWELNDSCIGMLNKNELLPYIGKKDIEGNKIYADCSIISLVEPYHGSELKGVFVWCKKTFRYKIHILRGTGRFQRGNTYEIMRETRWSGLSERFIDYKTIDTIQENKLGLSKKGE